MHDPCRKMFCGVFQTITARPRAPGSVALQGLCKGGTGFRLFVEGLGGIEENGDIE